MLTLRDFQLAFRAAIRGEASETLLRLVCADGVDPTARLAIYRNNVTSRLTDVLQRVYPVVRALVGQQFFAYAADEFIRGHLPRGACLDEYGADFPRFLQEFPASATLAYLPDIARLEWHVDRVRQAPTTRGMSIAELAQAAGDPAELRLRITPATAFVASAHRIDLIWSAHQADSDFQALQLDTAGVHLQISAGAPSDHTRAELYWSELPPEQWTFRANLAAGETLGTALARATEVATTFDPAAALACLFAEDLVVGVTCASEPSISNTV